MFKISDFLETFPKELGLKNARHHLFCSLWYFSVAVNRVATYRELDNDLLRQAAFQVLVSVVLKGPPCTGWVLHTDERSRITVDFSCCKGQVLSAGKQVLKNVICHGAVV